MVDLRWPCKQNHKQINNTKEHAMEHSVIKLKGDLTEYTPVGWSNIWISERYQRIPAPVEDGPSQRVNHLTHRTHSSCVISFEIMNIISKNHCVYLLNFAFCSSFCFSSSSGSAPSQPLLSAAASPWSSQCLRNSDWGCPEEARTILLLRSDARERKDECVDRTYHFSLCS